ncbi:hypothetical protein [Burkholderia gladioli]|uniref:hypothetical protein n=1 Tax=Burkholderia gladioli TaxID=28095 RepID=UPI0016407282|nr:hypothetical protein [Burkholderia gladioli]
MAGIVWWMPTRAGPTGAGPAIDAVAPAFPGPRDDRPVQQVSCQAEPRPKLMLHRMKNAYFQALGRMRRAIATCRAAMYPIVT